MKAFRVRTISSISIAVSALLFATAAQADVDAKRFADALISGLALQGINVTIANAEKAGANVVAKGWVFGLDGIDAKSTELGDITFENVIDVEDSYHVEQVKFPPQTVETAEGVFEFGGATLKNINVSGSNEQDPVKKFYIVAETIEIGPMKLNIGGVEIFHATAADIISSPYQKGKVLTMDATVTGIYGNISAVSDPKAQEFFSAAGYKELNGKMTTKTSWNPIDGSFRILEQSFDFKDVGKLNLAMEISGYTFDFIRSLQAWIKTMSDKDSSEKDADMLRITGQLTFKSLSLRFDDASLTRRTLDYFAHKNDQPRPAIVRLVNSAVAVLLMKLQNPDFATSAAAAVSAYLDTTKSIEISAAPAAPIPFSVLMATGSSSPPKLIKQLDVKVTANE